MKQSTLPRPTRAFWALVLVMLGALAIAAGVRTQFGDGWALIVGGAEAVAIALTMVDVD